ncbi:MAG: hypothetical protein RR334_01485, partial [Clostridia bacterium]
LRLYHEFDRMQEALSKETCPQNIKDIMYYALSTTKNNHINKVSAQLLASLGSIVGFDKKLTYDLFKKIDPEVSKDDLDERIDKIKYLFENYMPDEKTELLKEKNVEYFNSLSDDEKKDIISLHTSLLNNNYSLESLQTLLYDTCKRDNDDKKQTMEKQKRFFENVYMLLTGKSAGPRLYLFLGALNLDSYIELLNF